MADTKTTNETTKTPIDGTELVRLATAGANWKSTISAIVGALGLLKANNLNDVANAGTARTSLGLGALAVKGDIAVADLNSAIYASQAEVEAGTENTKVATSLRVKQGAVAAVSAQLGGIPQNSQSASYTLVAADAGLHIFHPSADTTARTWTIPSNAAVAFAIGTSVTFVNQNAAGVITIGINSDTLRLAGPGTTGSRMLAANGVATALKVASTEWIISGAGLT